MIDPSATRDLALGSGGTERETGLATGLGQRWERRYGFPQPDRDAFGERVYDAPQIDKLRVIKRLMDAGQRPGKRATLSSAGSSASFTRPAG